MVPHLNHALHLSLSVHHSCVLQNPGSPLGLGLMTDPLEQEQGKAILGGFRMHPRRMVQAKASLGVWFKPRMMVQAGGSGGWSTVAHIAALHG